jgi:hypothetical protein
MVTDLLDQLDGPRAALDAPAPYRLPAALPWLLDQVTQMLPVVGCWAVVLAASPGPRRFVASADPLTRRLQALEAGVAESPGLRAARTGNRVLLADLGDRGALDSFQRFVPLAVVAGAAAVHSFPLWCAGRRIGGLSVCGDVPVHLEEVDLELTQKLADLASALIVSAQHDPEAPAWSL